ncbi:VanZ family protein [bacterium]|nr:VanZ family protein [bacterium]
MNQEQIDPQQTSSNIIIFCIFHLPPLAMALAIFVASSFSIIMTPNLGFDWQDKVYHATAYAVFGTLIYRSFSKRWGISLKMLNISLLSGILYGISDEVHQAFVPGRFADWTDALADAVGIFIGVSIWRIILYYKNN